IIHRIYLIYCFRSCPIGLTKMIFEGFLAENFTKKYVRSTTMHRFFSLFSAKNPSKIIFVNPIGQLLKQYMR
ncbi:MAG: hypothetical protein AAF621_03005, partial [Pseudomonadota bacterium]